MSEKTEQPSSKRLRDARKKGQVAKSMDLTTAAQLGLIALLFVFFGQSWYQDIQDLLAETLLLVTHMEKANTSRITLMWALEFARITGIFAAGITTVTLLVQFAQVGIMFSFEVFANAGSKLNVMSNLKNMFSVKNLFELGKSLVKIILIGIIFYIILRRQFSSFQHASSCGLDCALPLLSHLCLELFLGLLAGYLFFAIADYSFQRHTLMKQLRMTKEEVKQEHKDSEGNPEIKQRRRETHREIQHDHNRQKVRKSSVIIKNPTHLCVCLAFNMKTCPVPKVIEKAWGAQARRITALAEQEGIPVVENISLARGLMRNINTGDFITPEFFEPVAEILRLVMNIPYDGDVT